MPVNIHGKQYATVVERVNEFRTSAMKDWTIKTELVQSDQTFVVMKAEILDTEGRLIGTGFAEEVRGSSNINTTSALENCETSAIGRALANVGLGGDVAYSTANEVTQALIQQEAQKMIEPYTEAMNHLAAHNEMVRKHLASIQAVKDAIASKDYYAAGEAWFELPEDEQRALWIAPSKGGIFTTEERTIIKEELRKAYFEGEE